MIKAVIARRVVFRTVPILFSMVFFSIFVSAQEQIEKRGSDPMQNKIRTDSTEVNALLNQSEGQRFSNPDSSIILARQAIELSEDINFEVGKARGFKNIGLVYGDKNDFGDALDYFNRSLAVYKKELDTAGISAIQNNIGSVHQTMGDNPKALQFFMQSLRNAEVVQDPLRIGTAFVNLGTVYSNDDLTLDQANENFRKSIPFFEEIDYVLGLAVANVNIGEVFLKQAEIHNKKSETLLEQEKARLSIPYLEDALDGFREVGIDPATPLNLLGLAYLRMGQLESSQDYYQQGLSSALEKGTKSEEAKAYIGLGNSYLEEQNSSLAIQNFSKGLDVARETGLLREMSESLEGLSKAYALRRDYPSAYRAQQEFAAVQDSLRRENYANEMSELRTVFDLERREKENDLLKAENALNEIQIEKDARDKMLLKIILGLFLAIIAGFVFQFFYIRRTNKRLAFERNRSEQILLNILPKETADELKENGFIKAKEFEQITVLFTDFKAFSVVAERISGEMLVKSVDYYFKNFDAITERNNVEKIKTIGDAYMCAGGIPTPNSSHAEDAFRAAKEILDFVKETELNPPSGVYPFKIRIGLNSGPVVAGVVGVRKFAYDVWGNTVNIAARMESSSVPGRINVSESTYELLKDKHQFSYRGEIEAKNGKMLKMYFAVLDELVTA
ncbi:adenylate/guanylate cyclase domain-containing protein [Robiginitalea aurantiaca]|uniref:Adenylate/guanylate cyclase domain-containing protein n=1 Tax=Robiginitalea aurantiaca TaxID=3056915 RepID=A0ABT7WHC1_9FLAO|nr:adenylate/guanylate cyclase domain-containing protein [Robiginitalea aurantiaca]MDM9632258.1 adenylate/guanylate cyclase domain-containing protein [Robiginitalea aurantiaca]